MYKTLQPLVFSLQVSTCVSLIFWYILMMLICPQTKYLTFVLFSTINVSQTKQPVLQTTPTVSDFNILLEQHTVMQKL